VSADPALGHLSAPQTLDRYAYAVNNPQRFGDPSGRDPPVLFGAIIGAVVGYAGCGLATGNWISWECGEAAVVGAVVGALAGLTFGASLALAGSAGLGTAAAGGGFTFVGVSGLAAFTFAGATSGAIAGAAGYFGSGGVALANGQQWSFNSRDFINSVGTGIIVGAATGALGYGASRGLSRLLAANRPGPSLYNGARIGSDELESAMNRWMGPGERQLDWYNENGFQFSRTTSDGSFRFQARYEAWARGGLDPPHMNLELWEMNPLTGSAIDRLANLHIYFYDIG